MTDLTPTFKSARRASVELALLSERVINRVLERVAHEAVARSSEILTANSRDLAQMSPENPMYDRLMLTPERLESIAADLRNVARLSSPVGETLSETTRPNGMTITKIRVPFGVVGVIYEARPNVSFDVFALCLKSGNACLLKGGSDARHSNEAIVRIIRESVEGEGLNPDIVTLLPADREATEAMLGAVGWVDVVIPRGSSALINHVRDHSRVPVIETGAGICHTYFDAEGDTDKGAAIVFNAKTRRVSVCNALDTLIVHSSRLADLPQLCGPLMTEGVTIYADPRAFAALEDGYPPELLEHATEESFGTEFMDYKMSLRTVDTLDEALEHISRHSSRHSEAIVTENRATADAFAARVDAACVYTNVSTAFTDGAQFGFGAEIGISTQKLHARGPMALPELTTYKYLIRGEGQIRN
ncbi:MAG: glutamate-5-semialdehyde dehydrogenase [Alistipes sp.]|jgi:glutamate-5-semialdehyde dehydrogenase|nr:glutamate-5-semialdehyde dehydrogenase [Alistipes sp.]